MQLRGWIFYNNILTKRKNQYIIPISFTKEIFDKGGEQACHHTNLFGV